MIPVRGHVTTAEVSDLKSGNYSTLHMKDKRYEMNEPQGTTDAKEFLFHADSYRHLKYPIIALEMESCRYKRRLDSLDGNR